MNKALLAASAAMAAIVMAAPASATVVINDQITIGSIPASDYFEAAVSGETGAWTTAPSGFNFTLAGPFLAGASISAFQLIGLNDINFTKITLDSVVLYSGAGITSFVSTPITLTGSSHSLVVEGTGNGIFNGTFGVAVAPIPEPATWAMMIAGIAAVGMTMRRRNQSVRVAFS